MHDVSVITNVLSPYIFYSAPSHIDESYSHQWERYLSWLHGVLTPVKLYIFYLSQHTILYLSLYTYFCDTFPILYLVFRVPRIQVEQHGGMN